MKQYCLIGTPIRHSLSPAMMNYSFGKTGVDARYGLRETDEASLEETVREMKREGTAGWNVTMPCKRAMSLLCDELSTEARIGGSVNTVANEGGRLTGYTTDGIGFMNAAAKAGCSLKGGRMTLMGSGGAASAILIRAALEGLAEISVFCNRPSSAEHVRHIAEKLRPYSGTTVRVCSYDDPEVLRREIRESRALVNATNVGMAGNASGSPASLIPDASFFHEGLFVFDIIYHPAVTPLLRMARSAGIPAEGGLGMLVEQGAESFRIWTGRDMPVEEVRALAEKTLTSPSRR